MFFRFITDEPLFNFFVLLINKLFFSDIKPTKAPRLRCYKCDFKDNAFCYYGLYKHQIDLEECSLTGSQYAYCETRILVEKGEYNVTNKERNLLFILFPLFITFLHHVSITVL